MLKYQVLLLLVFTNASWLRAQQIYPVKKNGKYGFINNQKEWIVKPVYDWISNDGSSSAYLVMKNDSIFVLDKQLKLFQVQDIKRVKRLGFKRYALQHISGMWAIADQDLELITTHKYARIEPIDTFLRVTLKRKEGLVTKDGIERLPIQYEKIKANGSSSFTVYKKNEGAVLIHTDTGFHELNRGLGVKYFSGLYPFFKVLDEEKNDVYFNLQGDTIAVLKSTRLVGVVGRYIIFGYDQGYAIYDIVETKRITSFDSKYELNFKTGRMGYIYVNKQRLLFYKHKFRQVEYSDVASFNSSFLMVKQNGLTGLIDSNYTEILPCKYKMITHIQDNYFNVSTSLNSAIWESTQQKVIFQFKHLGRFVISEGNVIAAFPNKQAWYYSIDENFRKTDSLQLRNYVMIRPSNRRRWNANAAMSTVQRELKPIWFTEDREDGSFYGLLSDSGDTLIRAMLISVVELNDSICRVGIRRFEHKMFMFRGYAKVFSTHHYGLVNQNTGKWEVVPKYPYMDDKAFMDTSLSAFRVRDKDNHFYLVHKSNYQRIKETKATFISESVNGYYRIFKNAEISLKSTRKTTSDKPHFLLTQFSELTKFGKVQYRKNTGNEDVYIWAKSVQIANSNGDILFSDSIAEALDFVHPTFKDDFIAINKKGNYGVLTSIGQVKLPFRYANIDRLGEDSTCFVLQLYKMKQGVVDESGEVLSLVKFDKIEPFYSDYSWAKLGDSTCLIDKTGSVLYVAMGKTRTNSVFQNRTAIRSGRYYVLLDERGNEIANDGFTYIGEFNNGFAYAKSRDKGHGIINEEGEWVFSGKLYSFKKESPHYFVFNGPRKKVILSRKGEVLGKTKKRNSVTFYEGQEVFGLRGKKNMQFLNTDMKPISRKKFGLNSIYFNDTVLSIKSSSIYYRNITDHKIRARYKYKGGLTAYEKGKLYFDKVRGDQDLPVKKLNGYHFLYPHVFKKKQNKVIYTPMPEIGRVKLVNLAVPECIYNNALIYAVANGAVVEYGLYDTLGNRISGRYFKSLKYIGNQLYHASFTDSSNVTYCGIINHLGVWVVDPKFNQVSNAHNGLFVVSSRTNYQIANAHGKTLEDLVFSVIRYEQGYYLLKGTHTLSWWHPTKGWLYRED